MLHCCSSYCVWVRVCVQPFPWRLLVRNLSARVRCCQFSRWSRVSCYTTVFYKGEVCVFSTDENLPASTKKKSVHLIWYFPSVKVSICEFQAAPLYPPQFKNLVKTKWAKICESFVKQEKKSESKKKVVKLTEAKILLVNLKWTNFGDYVHQGW